MKIRFYWYDNGGDEVDHFSDYLGSLPRVGDTVNLLSAITDDEVPEAERSDLHNMRVVRVVHNVTPQAAPEVELERDPETIHARELEEERAKLDYVRNTLSAALQVLNRAYSGVGEFHLEAMDAPPPVAFRDLIVLHTWEGAFSSLVAAESADAVYVHAGHTNDNGWIFTSAKCTKHRFRPTDVGTTLEPSDVSKEHV